MAGITLGILARNAAKTILECLESAGPYVEQIVVGFGGESDDLTEDLVAGWLKNWADEPGTKRLARWYKLKWQDDFSRARNTILEKVDTEWFLWLDADDILINGQLMQAVIDQNDDANCITFPYHYDQDEFGNLSVSLIRERLVRNPQEWKWVGTIHEILSLPDKPWVPVYAPEIVVRHNPRRHKDKGTRNLDLLYKELEQTEPDPPQRLLFYLGRENASRGNMKEALLHFNRYIARADRNEEAYQVAVMAADALRASGRLNEAAMAAFKAISIMPTWPDAYHMLGRICYEEHRFEEAIEWFRTGSEKEPPITGLITSPRTYDYYPAYYAGLSYVQLGDHQGALDNLKTAASLRPDAQLMTIMAAEQAEVDAETMVEAFLVQHEQLARYDEWLKARQHFKTVPKLIERHPRILDALERTLAQTAHIDNPRLAVQLYGQNPRWTPMPDDEIWSDAWARHPRMAFARRSISCDPPATILDFGSSDGFISLPLAKDGHIVEGLDLHPFSVDLANKRAQALGLRARYQLGSIENVEGKYDVALAMEVIEHLPDPGAFLDQLDEHARKVVLTTPFMAWENGQADWRKLEPKEHVRIFTLDDIEIMLSRRGRIFDLYREPHGLSSWIFASYRPRQTYSGSIAFLAPGTLEAWSPRKLREQGLGGSETALIRLAEELFLEADLMCSTYGRIDNPGYYNGVRYRPWETYDPRINFDVVVAWRYPEAADLPTSSPLILWCHDMGYGDRLTPARAGRFEAIVVLTEWHKQYMLQQYPWLDPDKLVIIGNGVDGKRFALSRKGGNFRREPHRVAYTSSPDRGLDFVLEKIWPQVVENVPDAELHVYYGFNNWQAITDPSLQAYKRRVQDLLLQTKNVVLHGRVNQDELAQDLLKTAVWLYPSKMPSMPPWNGHDWYETYCIAAVEAQMAGAIPVTTDLAALAETIGAGVVIPSTMDRDNTATAYVEAVTKLLLADPKELSRMRTKMRKAVPAHGWDDIATAWSSILQPNEDRDSAS